MASSALGSATEARVSSSDLIGVIVLGSCVLWALVTAAGREARPEGVLLAVLAVTAGYAVGKICGSQLPVAAPTLVALVAVAIVLATGRGLEEALPRTQGRAGADAALLTLAAGAACCAAWAARGKAVRLTLRLVALGVGALALAIGSIAGLTGALVVALVSLAAERTHRALAFAALLLVTAGVTGATWAAAEDALPAGLSSAMEGQLTEHRLQLWADAVTLAGEHPLLGTGPDSFGERSPTAQESALGETTPHSAPLQLAAEQGLPGVALLAAVFGWLLLALFRSPRPTPVVLTVAVTLAALAALASVGNALSFNQVTTGAGLLAGLASARPPTR